MRALPSGLGFQDTGKARDPEEAKRGHSLTIADSSAGQELPHPMQCCSCPGKKPAPAPLRKSKLRTAASRSTFIPADLCLKADADSDL